MTQQIPLGAENEAGTLVRLVYELAPDLAYQRLTLANVMMVGAAAAKSGGWVLIDAGIPGSLDTILDAAAARFGVASHPAAIILTHGHFDHVGALESLVERWGVPVYAHPLEHPYLDGSASYPPPDPKVGGGLMSYVSPLYPRGPVNVGAALRALPEDGSVPFMPGWRWLHTPGHSVGHVSFWREHDRALIAGDAVITTAQESAYAVATGAPELHGPPMYFTHDWPSARRSAERLAALEPELIVTGHGHAMHGSAMRAALHRLAREFDHVARPEHAQYARHPARAEDGSAYVRTNPASPQDRR